jgi:putative peptidoglycan lipid II flippase
MRALFLRGAFTNADAAAASATLAAYAIGLLPFVLIRSMSATFFARGDTATPVKAALIAAAVNIAFKIFLMGALAQVGLALATSIGAWINLVLVIWFASQAGLITFDDRLKRSILGLAGGGLTLAVLLWAAERPIAGFFSAAFAFGDLVVLASLAAGGGFVYSGLILLLLGPHWLSGFSRGLNVAELPGAKQ